jgi:hypothetical protein
VSTVDCNREDRVSFVRVVLFLRWVLFVWAVVLEPVKSAYAVGEPRSSRILDSFLALLRWIG